MKAMGLKERFMIVPWTASKRDWNSFDDELKQSYFHSNFKSEWADEIKHTCKWISIKILRTTGKIKLIQGLS